MNRFLKFFLWVVFLGSSNLVFAKTYKVAVALRFEEAAQQRFINSLYNGIELAKEQFTLAHPKTKIELVKYSHKLRPDSIRDVAKQIDDADIKFAIGGESSDEAKILSQEFEKNKIVYMTPTSSNPEVTRNKKFAFRACFSDDQVAKALAKYAFDTFKGEQTIGIVHNTGNSYTHFLTKTFFEELGRLNKKGSLKIIKREYSGENFSFDDIARVFALNRAQNVILFTGASDFYRFVDTAQRQKFFPIYLGSDGWGTQQDIVENLGKQNLLRDFTGVLNSYWHAESERPEVQKFIKDYKSKYAHAPDGWNAIAYDAAVVLFNAIEKSEDGDVDHVAKALRATELKGMITSPDLKYEGLNSPKKALYLYEISANRAAFKTAIE